MGRHDPRGDGRGARPPRMAGACRRAPVVAGVAATAGAALVAWSWWTVGLPEFSGAATVGVVGSGVAAVAAGLGARVRRRRAGRGPGDGARGSAARSWGWAALAVVAGGWQLAAYLQHPRSEHPTLSSLTNALLSSHPTRAAAFVAWLVVAVELARR